MPLRRRTSPAKRERPSFVGSEWWARQDSNLQPDRYERSALTIELQAPRLSRKRKEGPSSSRGEFEDHGFSLVGPLLSLCDRGVRYPFRATCLCRTVQILTGGVEPDRLLSSCQRSSRRRPSLVEIHPSAAGRPSDICAAMRFGLSGRIRGTAVLGENGDSHEARSSSR